MRSFVVITLLPSLLIAPPLLARNLFALPDPSTVGGAVSSAVTGGSGNSRDSASAPRPATDESHSSLGDPAVQPPVLLPLQVRVIDKLTGEPVTEFAYAYRIFTPENQPGTGDHFDLLSADSPRGAPEVMEKVVSQEGTFQMEAPPACKISIWIDAPGFVSGPYETWKKYIVKSGDSDRQLVFELERGFTIRGVVRDAKTEQPISGANVCPLVFGGTIWYPDPDRGIVTGADGRYELDGVDCGISITHPDYLKTEIHSWTLNPSKAQGVVIDRDVMLETGETASGMVVDSEGNPLAGVTVSDGSGKSVVTDRDGVFILPGPRKWSDQGRAYYFSFQKEGYIKETIRPQEIVSEDLIITLQTPIKFCGQVISSEGAPVEAYTIFAGPGKMPREYMCSKADVVSIEGRFSLDLDKPGDYWVGIRAQGQSAFEDLVTVRRGMGPVRFELSEGVRVFGKIEFPAGSRGDIKIRLLPDRETAFSNRDLAVKVTAGLEESVSEDGSFVIKNVRPDNYSLRISGRGITPLTRSLAVSDRDVDLGVVKPRSAGRVVGRVFRRGEVWSFARGAIYRAEDYPGSEGIHFTTDERGEFAVDGAPVGKVIISLPYHATTDLVGSLDKVVEVFEGETTEVNIE